MDKSLPPYQTTNSHYGYPQQPQAGYGSSSAPPYYGGGYAAPPGGFPTQGGYQQLPPDYSPPMQRSWEQGGYADAPPPPYSPPPKMDEMILPPEGAKPKFQDVWASLLFVANLAGFAVLSYYALTGPKAAQPPLTGSERDALLYVLLSACGFSAFIGTMSFLLTKASPTRSIYVSQILVIALLIAYAVFVCIITQSAYGIIFGILALLQVLIFFSFRPFIPFAALMLETVMDIILAHPSSIFAEVLAGVVQIAWSVFFTVVFVGALSVWTDGTLIAVALYMAFSFYWTSQVIQNTIHVSVSGLFATHYFFSGSTYFPPNPMAAAFKRAVTYSFGSICFGSLLVALVKTLRYLVRILFNENKCLRCCLDCMLAMVDGILRYFNHYAYAEVAIYGQSFCTSGRRASRLFETSGLFAVIKDDLIGNILLSTVLVSALGSFGVGYGVAVSLLDNDKTLALYFGLVALFLGAMISVVLSALIESGSAATFVCMAEDPNALLRNNPALHRKIRQTCDEIAERLAASAS